MLRIAFVGVVLAALSFPVGCSGCTPPAEGEGEGEGGGGGGGGGEPVEVITCDTAPAADPGDAVCAVTPGSAGLVVVGELLLPGQVYQGGGVSLDEDGTISCVG